MAWIELHQTLPRHPKLFRLAAKLRIPRAQAAGHLTFLWLWTLDYSPTGDLSAFGPAEISAAADFGGDADAFVVALRETGWVEADGHIHDWMEFAGRIVIEREQSKARMRTFREQQKALRARLANVPVTNTERSELPNPTQPNPTKNASPSPRARGSESWPSQAEVAADCEMRGIPADVGEAFWNHFEASGWVDKNGNPVQQWRPKLTTWWLKEQEELEKQKHAENGNGLPRASTGSPRPPTVFEMTKVLEAKESLAAGIRGKHCSDVAGGTSWDSEAKREEWRKIRSEIKELKERIAKAV